MRKILILGTIPPPIGGVTIHVKRLCEQLKGSNISWSFVDIKRDSSVGMVFKIIRSKIIHLHSSNPYVRLIFAISCFITAKKLLLTYHGNIGRYGRFKNFIDRLSIRMTGVPIVINKKSYKISKGINTNSLLISAFIPPLHITPLEEAVMDDIYALKKGCDTIFCTNAFNISYDRRGKETYQITELIRLFNKLSDKGLIVSDPSGQYKRLLKEKGISISSNILLLPFEHDFNAVIRECDCMIRFTTTDGDSLSVKEALMAGRSVIATNIVDRPAGVILVNDNALDLEELVRAYKFHEIRGFNENGFETLKKLYNNLLYII